MAEPTASSNYQDGFYKFLSKVGYYFSIAWRWAAYGIGSVVLSILLLILIFSLFAPSTSSQTFQEHTISGSGIDKIAVLNLTGIIGAVSSGLPLENSTGVSTDLVRQQLQQAADDPSVQAIILHIDSPGGSAVISDEIWQEITDFKTDSKKPVVAQFGDTAASGGYYIATAADKIVANPATLTGSIGVIMEYYDASGLLNNIGVNAGVVKSGPYKDIGSFTRPTSAEEQAILQSVVDDAYQQFLDRVSSGRNMDMDKLKPLADGRIYTGAQAKQNSLIDELGNLDKAVSIAKDLADISSATVVEYTHGGILESLLAARSRWFSIEGVLGLPGPSTQTASGLQYLWRP